MPGMTRAPVTCTRIDRTTRPVQNNDTDFDAQVLLVDGGAARRHRAP